MNILVTNDDGYSDSGIKTLFNALKDAGHNVFMVAPLSNRSAISAALTLTRHISVQSHGDHIWSLDGNPCDCVITAFYSDILDGALPDLVISGINDGGNIGTDITYSGTCAAARQGSLYNTPSIALSMTWRLTSDSGSPLTYSDSDKVIYYRKLCDYVVKNLSRLKGYAQKNSNECFLNINVYSFDKWLGERFCSTLSNRKYFDRVVIKGDGDSSIAKVYGKEPESSNLETCDFYACSNGYIALSRVFSEPQSSVF